MSSAPPAPTASGLRTFGLVMAAMVAGLFGLALPWLFGRALPMWPWIVAFVFALPALFVPTWLAPVHRGWMAVGAVLGWINTRILLAAMFYLVMAPVGLIMRLVGRDPMRRERGAEPSYRQPSAERASEDMERPF
jgi:Saxitoxin biosynthesis operon protein SxtJ